MDIENPYKLLSGIGDLLGGGQPQWGWTRSGASAFPVVWPAVRALHTAELKRQGGKGLLVSVCEFTSEKAGGGDFKREAFSEGAITFASLCSLQCRVCKAIKEVELL